MCLPLLVSLSDLFFYLLIFNFDPLPSRSSSLLTGFRFSCVSACVYVIGDALLVCCVCFTCFFFIPLFFLLFFISSYIASEAHPEWTRGENEQSGDLFSLLQKQRKSKFIAVKKIFFCLKYRDISFHFAFNLRTTRFLFSSIFLVSLCSPFGRSLMNLADSSDELLTRRTRNENSFFVFFFNFIIDILRQLQKI